MSAQIITVRPDHTAEEALAHTAVIAQRGAFEGVTKPRFQSQLVAIRRGQQLPQVQTRDVVERQALREARQLAAAIVSRSAISRVRPGTRTVRQATAAADASERTRAVTAWPRAMIRWLRDQSDSPAPLPQ